MIKFFRKIRQNLLSEGKTGKYLKYAFGEILLVMVGILLALQVNNWNQNRIQSKKEGIYLNNLEKDLEYQIVSIEAQMTSEQEYKNIAKSLLDRYVISSNLHIDSIISKKLGDLTKRKTFILTDPTYQDLISTGNIGLIEDQDIRNELIEYYQELKRLDKIIQNNNTAFVDELYSRELLQSVYIGNITTQQFYSISNDLLSDPDKEMKLINLISFRHTIAQFHLGIMADLKNQTTSMIEILKTGKERMENPN